VRRAALRWYGCHARDLPWRKSVDPYAVWISEIMLQQTQVRTVEAYFERFLARFPTLAALAAASESEVLRLWEGLGYYRRARQLWQAAQQIVSQFAGEFPRTRERLEQLPGVGPYTAGAILSIAFDQPEPILEANTHRLWCRLLNWAHPPQSPRTRQRLWDAARRVLGRQGAGRLNQALMELGSQVCLPQRPRCPECPLARLCMARRLGRVHRVPRTRPRPPSQHLRQAVGVVRQNGRVLLVQALDNARWAGLWDFPRVTLHRNAEPRQQLRQYLQRDLGIATRGGPLLLELTHSVTRYRIRLQCYELRHQQGRLCSNGSLHARWVRLDALDCYPLSATGRRIAHHIAGRTSARAVRGDLPHNA
jgi:A/G-specific adenine glycosylase